MAEKYRERNFRAHGRTGKWAFIRVQCLQALGINSIRMGKISRRPISMHMDSTSLLRSEKAAKLPVGPTISNPGPMFESVAMTAVIFVSKENPSREMISVDRIRMEK